MTVIEKKLPRMNSFGLYNIFDNARPHTEAIQFEGLLFRLLSYSPDLSSSDYHMLVYLKKY